MRHHAHHYLGFAETQWRLFLNETPQRVKPLLYVFRVLLSGIHLMQTGMVEANLVTLNETFQLTYIPNLVARKLAGPEHGVLANVDVAFFGQEFVRLHAALAAARDGTQLPRDTFRPPGVERSAGAAAACARISTWTHNWFV